MSSNYDKIRYDIVAQHKNNNNNTKSPVDRRYDMVNVFYVTLFTGFTEGSKSIFVLSELYSFFG